MSEHLCRSRGFTLIEIMVVLGIVAILAAIAIPLFDSYSDDAKIEELKSVMLVAAVSQENEALYRSDFTRWCWNVLLGKRNA